MLPMRGGPRLLIIFGIVFLSLLLLLASPFSGHAGRKSRSLVKSVVEKVQKGELGRITMSGPISETAEELAMREWEYRRAVQYEGTGGRIQGFIDKARSGRPFTVSVIGGSVSKGRGLKPADDRIRRDVHLAVRQDQDQSAPEGDTVSLAADPEAEENVPPISTSDHDAVAVADTDKPKSKPRLGADTLYSPENLHVLIFDWLNATYPHPQNRLVNGAQGGVGSGYFSWCFKEHIPEESDLVLVELGINDLIEVDVLGSYEHLMRGILELPNSPAIINIETFTTLFPTLLSAGSLHLDVAAFYDIPSLSIRDVLLPRLLADPETQMPRWFRTGPSVKMGDNKVKEWGGVPVDLMHISALGHALAAGLVIRYLGDQIDKSRPSTALSALGKFAAGSLRQSDLRITELPAAALTMPFDRVTGLARHDPTCRSMNSPRLHTPPGASTEVQGVQPLPQTSGWETWAWKEKIYLVGKTPGSVISVPFTVLAEEPNAPTDEIQTNVGDDETSARIGFEPLPLALRPKAPYKAHPMGVVLDNVGRKRNGRVETGPVVKRQYPAAEDAVDGARVVIGFQRSATLGLGSVFCWVDEDKSGGRRVEGWWEIAERNMGMVEEVASGIQPGAHVLHCELLEHTLDPNGGTEFRIFAVMHD